MQIQSYTISPKVKSNLGQALYLTANPSGAVSANVKIMDGSKQSASQLWVPIFQPGTRTVQLISCGLSTAGTAYAIDAPSDSRAVALVPQQNLKRGNWTYCASGALQLQANTDMNLNLSGSENPPFQSGTLVLAWKWDDSPNAKWEFTANGLFTLSVAIAEHAGVPEQVTQ